MTRKLQTLRSLATLTFVAAASAPVLGQTTLQLSVEDAAGQSVVFALPGQAIDFGVAAELGGDPSEGLAMFAFDLAFSGGALTPLVPPSQGPLQEFVSPRGFNNPEGFGGTVRGGDLLQVGGAMNTIANTFAPVPSGTVVTGVGNGGGPLVLATGTLTAPQALGSYSVDVSGVFANALEAQDPAGFWRVSAVEGLAPRSLSIVVVDCLAQPYCTAKVNSAGCTADIVPSGMASVSGATTLTLQLDNVINRQFGLFIWSNAEAQTPLYGGTLCVAQPFGRSLEPTRSGGVGPAGMNCNGSFTRVIDATFLAPERHADGRHRVLPVALPGSLPARRHHGRHVERGAVHRVSVIGVALLLAHAAGGTSPAAWARLQDPSPGAVEDLVELAGPWARRARALDRR